MRAVFSIILLCALSHQAVASPPQTAGELMEDVRRTAEYGGIASLCDDNQTSIEASAHFTHLVNVALLRGVIPVHRESDYYRAFGEQAKTLYALKKTQEERGMQPPADACEENSAEFIVFKVSSSYDLNSDTRMAEALRALRGRIAGGDGSDDPKLAKAYAILRGDGSSASGGNWRPGVNDKYDPFKSDQVYSNAMDMLKNRSNPSANKGPSLGWAEKLDPAITVVLVAFVVGVLLMGKNLSDRVPGRYEGVLTVGGKPRWWVVAGLAFIFLKGLVDLYVAISNDNALNLLFGLLGVGCVLMPFTARYRARFLLIAGCWMLIRGVLNLALFIGLTEGLGEFLATMPIRMLPNVAMSYVLPIAIGAYFLRLHRSSGRHVS